MKFKKFGFVASALILAGATTGSLVVKADDDEYEHEYRYEDENGGDYYNDQFRDGNYEGEEKNFEDHDDDEYYEHEDEGEYYGEDNGNYGSTTVTPNNQTTWNVWTRTTTVNKGTLPFTDAQTVKFKTENGNNELSVYVIPRDGEFFVPGKSIAELLGAKAKFYDTSKILEVKTDNTELVFRADTNVAFDNNLKTPLPSTAFYMNNQLYLPVSVLTNGLGYSVEWQKDNNTFLCKTLTK